MFLVSQTEPLKQDSQNKQTAARLYRTVEVFLHYASRRSAQRGTGAGDLIAAKGAIRGRGAHWPPTSRHQELPCDNLVYVIHYQNHSPIAHFLLTILHIR